MTIWRGIGWAAGGSRRLRLLFHKGCSIAECAKIGIGSTGWLLAAVERLWVRAGLDVVWVRQNFATSLPICGTNNLHSYCDARSQPTKPLPHHRRAVCGWTLSLQPSFRMIVVKTRCWIIVSRGLFRVFAACSWFRSDRWKEILQYYRAIFITNVRRWRTPSVKQDELW